MSVEGELRCLLLQKNVFSSNEFLKKRSEGTRDNIYRGVISSHESLSFGSIIEAIFYARIIFINGISEGK